MAHAFVLPYREYWNATLTIVVPAPAMAAALIPTLLTPTAIICRESRQAPPLPLGHVSEVLTGTVSVTVGGSGPLPGTAAGSGAASRALAGCATWGAAWGCSTRDSAELEPPGEAPDAPDPELASAAVAAGDVGVEPGVAGAGVAVVDAAVIPGTAEAVGAATPIDPELETGAPGPSDAVLASVAVMAVPVCAFDVAAGSAAVAGRLEPVADAAGSPTAGLAGAVWTAVAGAVEAVVEPALETDETGSDAVAGASSRGVSDEVVVVLVAEEGVVAEGELELGGVVVGPAGGGPDAAWVPEPLDVDAAVPGAGVDAAGPAAWAVGAAGAEVDELAAGPLAAAGVAVVVVLGAGAFAVAEGDVDELVAGGVDGAEPAVVDVGAEAADDADVDAALFEWVPVDGVAA